MNHIGQENVLARNLSWGGFLVTVVILNGTGFDPVNIPKSALLSVLAGSCLGVWIYKLRNNLSNLNKFGFYTLIAFAFGTLVNLLLGKSPFEMNFFGTSGRNTGTLTYLSFAIIGISALFVKQEVFQNKILKGFLLAGWLNLIYCSFIVVVGKDPFPWKNPYGTFLGTLGNPDFISAFLGMSFAVSFGYLLNYTLPNAYRVTLYMTLPVYIGLILKTRALQGLMIAILGFGLVIFFYLRGKYSKKIQLGYLAAGGTFAALLVLGMLQIGPLTKYVYKVSISIRGEYWRAAIQMFKESPLWGIGLDSYGDYYRQARSVSALVTPGLTIVTDTAHNVFLDILAGGGLLLFIPYILLHGFIALKSMQEIRRNRILNPIFICLFVGWLTFLAQSVVSINQIGIAIWGWIFSGLLLAYFGKQHLDTEFKKSIKSKDKSSQELKAGNFISQIIFALIFGILISPLVIAENRWKASLSKSDLKAVMKSTDSWPRSNARYGQTIGILLKNNLPNDALILSRANAKFDRDSFSAWYFIYNISQGQEEKAMAKSNLHRLDPLNPEYK